ncbi:ubiquitin conjugating enzyme [Trichoderma arundinaceum]|uniref:Ubiquitin conjugating enzyme n=1 Tax=Trichoderma arundinaceum TaxID=490622 RepID=A0A395NRV6_TRIAR|nr:ubiquitin conjugating enzyme [Trichoderma arundinaceum]
MAWTVYEGGEPVEFHMPAWGWPLVLANAIILIPVSLLINYTLFYIYPVFTIIEDENPPAYEPVALPSNGDDFDEEAGSATNKPTDGAPRTVTSSLRSINRLLTSYGGFRANLRGFMCALVQSFLTGIVASIFSWGPVKPFAELLASLVMVQFATAWVHIVISQPSPRRFWRRLPPFKRAFDATWKAVVIYWAATQLHQWIPLLLSRLIGFDAPTLSNLKSGSASDALRDGDISYLFKATAFVLLSTVLYVVVIIPARVVLVRIQASLLPEDEDPIIPFDRSFDGKVEPAVVGGLGYATVADAWSTFSKAAWRRVVILYAKILSIFVGVTVLSWAILLPTALAIMKAGTKST